MIARRHACPRACPVAGSGRGFTLLELVIVVAIVAILAAIVLPSYQESVRAGRRADGTTALLDLANRMQRYYSEHNTYVGAAFNVSGFPSSSASPQGYYTLSISVPDATHYTLTAAPTGSQSADTRCASLTLTQANVRNATGSDPGNCW